MNHYHQTIELNNTSAARVFQALTQEIASWWTEMYEGAADETGKTFTVRFGDDIFKTIVLRELVTNQKVVWQVTDALIHIPQLHHQKEWVGTTINWNLQTKEQGTLLTLNHIGLTPAVECYNICVDGWQQFTGSLKQHLETGQGHPFVKG